MHFEFDFFPPCIFRDWVTTESKPEGFRPRWSGKNRNGILSFTALFLCGQCYNAVRRTLWTLSIKLSAIISLFVGGGLVFVWFFFFFNMTALPLGHYLTSFTELEVLRWPLSGNQVRWIVKEKIGGKKVQEGSVCHSEETFDHIPKENL